MRIVELEILKTFRDFCTKNNIEYFLSNGTLLGAVKYKGFIPWDDDVDVFVPRADYDRMLHLFKDNEKYKLFAFERNSAYRYPFAKLCDMTTRKVEGSNDNGVTLGVDIDIFPLDAWSNNLDVAKKEAKRIKTNMFFLSMTKLSSAESSNWVKRIVKSVIMIGCKMFGSKFFVKRMVKLSRSRIGDGQKYLGCKSWCIYGTREIIPADVFAGTVEVEFEGEMFPAPVGYDKYLRSLYGDYWQDPPLEKQKTHHYFTAYRI